MIKRIGGSWKLNKLLGAEAFALGSKIAFAQSIPDKELVSHEVAHVIQQSGKKLGS